MAHVSAVSDLILNNFKRFPIGVGPEEEDFDFGRGEDPVERIKIKGSVFSRISQFRQLFEKSKFAIARFHELPKAFKLTEAEKSVIITEGSWPEGRGEIRTGKSGLLKGFHRCCPILTPLSKSRVSQYGRISTR